MNFCFERGSIPRRVWRAGAPPFLARKSGGHCTHPTEGPSFALNTKKLMRPRTPKQYCLQLVNNTEREISDKDNHNPNSNDSMEGISSLHRK